MSAPEVCSPVRLWRRAAAVALALGASAVIAGASLEIFARWTHMVPRVALVRSNVVHDFRVTPDGILLYTFGGHPSPCSERQPGVRTMSFFGSSITYGVTLDRGDAFPMQLEKHLAGSPSTRRCADDYSQPGFGSEQQWAMARDAVPSTEPDAVFWELWDPAKHYSVVGGVAFDARDRLLDSRGVPVLEGVPAVLADALFPRSYAYQDVALARSRVLPPPPGPSPFVTQICRTTLPALAKLVADHHGRLYVLVASPLDRPFAQVAPNADVLGIIACARGLGASILSIAALLSDQRVEDVRLDRCCHLNARGHALLAERVAARLGQGGS